MDIAAVVISITAVFVALVLAIAGIYFQYVLSRDTGKQLRDLGELVGEVRGLTTKTRETQEEQFAQLLNAALQEREKSVDAGATEIGKRIDALEESLSAQQPLSDQLRGGLEKLREEVRSLKAASRETVAVPLVGTVVGAGEDSGSPEGEHEPLRIIMDRYRALSEKARKVGKEAARAKEEGHGE